MSNRYQPPRYTPRPGYPNRRYESDKWERDRGSRTSRSPPPRPDRRDSRDFPREIDTDRAQRQPPIRDGAPPSAGSITSDTAGPRFPNQPFRTPSYSRVPPGRQEWPDRDYQNRGRQRPYEADVAGDSFRPNRSRSPRHRDRSGDSRDYDRREREYRDRTEDYRYRPPMRDSRDERDAYGIRREIPPRSDGRHPSDQRPLDSMSQTGSDRPRQSSPRRSPVDSRRPSMVGDGKDVRRPNDEAPSSVAVPQFGSIVIPAPSSNPSASTRPKSPASTPVPQLPPQLSPSQPSPTFSQSQPSPQPPSAQPARAPPTAPKALFNPPTAPKADRFGGPPAAKDLSLPPEDLRTRDAPRALTQAPVTPHAEQDIVTKARSVGSVGTSPVMMNQRLIPPTGPRSAVFPRASSAGPSQRDISPTQQSSSVPSGPRVSRDLASKGLPMNTPTAPKALSNPTWQAPTGPRLQKPYGPQTSLQWRANQPQTGQQPALLARSGTTSMVGVKRDANGDEKERSMSMDHSTGFEPTLPRRLSAIPQDRFDNKRLEKLRDVDMVDAPDRASSPEQTSGSYSASSDDGMSLDEDDFAKQEARYHRLKSELESQMIDLSTKRYRATTPIAELDRLNGILGIIDIMPFAPSPPPEEKMELEEPTDEPLEIENMDLIEPELEPELGPDPSIIPSDVAEEIITRKSSPELSRSPDFEYLPYLAQRPPTPLSMPENTPDDMPKGEDEVDDDIKGELLARLEEIQFDEASTQKAFCAEYAAQYPGWRQEVRGLDRLRRAAEPVVEPKPVEIPVEPLPELPLPPLPIPNEGGRRGHKYSSELELQRVLAESKLAEDLRREKEAREALEIFPSVEREAEVPPLLSAEEFKQHVFEDTSMKRTPEQALVVYEFAPPVDTIMEDVDKQFRALFKQYAKHWHKLADDLQVTTKEVINHYYATKWVYSYKRGSRKNLSRRAFNRKPAPARKPENENADSGALTLSGRPRRNAAPTFGKQEIDTEADGSTPTPGNGRRTKGDLVANAEDKAKKTKTKKEPIKKPRPGKTANPSPQKATKDKKEKIPNTYAEMPEDWMAGKHEPVIAQQDGRLMPTLMPHLQQQQQQPQLVNLVLQPQPALQPQPQLQQIPPPYTTDPVTGMPLAPHYREKQQELLGGARPTERARSNSQPQKHGASSYWSVGEDAEFRHCLEYFGTDFQAIANHMGKKTVVMIKNRYQKFRQDGKHEELLAAAAEADARRERGEPLPPMPEILRPHGAKAIMEEQIQSGIPIAPQQAIAHGSPQYRPLGRPSNEESPFGAGSPQMGQAIVHQSTPTSFGMARGSSKRGPPGIFESSPVRPPQHAQVQGSPSIVGQSQPELGTRQPKPVQRIKTEHVGEQSRLPVQQRERDPILLSRQDQLPPGINPYSGPPVAPSPGPNIIRPDPMRHDNSPHGPPYAGHIPIAGATAPRQHVIDLTDQGPRPGYPMGYDHSRGGRPQSPSLIVRDRSSGGYSEDRYRQREPAQASTPQSAASGSSAAPKRSVMSMASMLNPEPAEDKPRKAEFHQHSSSNSRAGNDLQQGHRSSSYHPGPNIASPASEIASAVSSSGQRDPWPRQGPTYREPYHDSPGLQAQPDGNRPPDYRLAFGNVQRHAPSPPPTGPYHSHSHSRTGSSSHPHHAQHHQPQHIQSQPGSQTNTPTEPYPRGGFAPTTAGVSPSPLSQAPLRHPGYAAPPPPVSGTQHGYPAYPASEAPLRAFRPYDPQPPPGHDPRMADPYGREIRGSPIGGERYPPPGPPGPPPPRGPMYERDYRMRDREREDERRYGP